MKIYAKNGYYLGIIEYENQTYILKPDRYMTEYMLEEALRIIKKLNEEENC
jgi:hypothetical protein